jgi:predicted permease
MSTLKPLRPSNARALSSLEQRRLEMVEEFESHIQLAIADRVARGESPEEARRRAMAEFGNMPLVADVTRERWGWLRLERLTQDLKYALRTLKRDRGFTAISILILALGVGANVVVFSVVHTILLRPLPFWQPERLVWIAPPDAGHDLSGATYSADAFEDYQRMNRSFAGITGYFAFSSPDNLKVTGHGDPRPVTDISVAGNFFDLLGVRPELGRGFTAEEQHNGGVVLVTHAYWKRYMGADPAVVGKTITLNDKPIPVVGVLPESFDFGAVFSPGLKVDMFDPQKMDDIRDEGNTLTFIGRLKPGVTIEQARTEGTEISRKLYSSKKYPLSLGQYKDGLRPIWLKEYVSGALERSLKVLWAAVGMILLIVCVNLANLMLARAATRTKEFALRISLGAGRGRLIRQLITESLVLSAAGSALGLALAYGATTWLAHQGSIALPLLSSVGVDGTVLAWTVVIAVVVGLVLGLAPAWKMIGTNLQESLKDSGPGTSYGRKHDRVRSALVISEVALACVLIVGAGLLLRSFMAVTAIDLGFQPSHAAAIAVDVPRTINTVEQLSAFSQEVLEKVSGLPGVDAAGLSDNLPLLRNRGWGAPQIKGKEDDKRNQHGAFVYIISPGYLKAIGTRLHGRDFAWSDDDAHELAMIVNQREAESLFPGQDAVGRMVTLQGHDVRVIGVIDDVHESNVEGKIGYQMYLPLMSKQWGAEELSLVVRSKQPVTGLTANVLQALRTLNPGQPATEFRTLDDVVNHATSPRRFFAILVGIFAGLGLILASLGIYGVISYGVTQQTQEIGIRMALGATRERVQAGVIGKTLRMALMGMALGVVASYGVARAIRSLLFGTQPTDLATFGAMLVLLTGVALLAGYLPARRASRIDPMTALRNL